MDDIDERNRVMRKTVSIILWLIFLLLVVSMISGVLNGTAESVVMFFKMFLVPTAVIENPGGALAIAGKAGIQFFIIWLFYHYAKKLWKEKEEVADKMVRAKGQDSEDRIEPKL